MGRKTVGAAPRNRLVALRLNPEESDELDAKSTRRGLGTSDYFRTLMKEDDHVNEEG